MMKTSMWLIAGVALAGAAAYILDRRKKNLSHTTTALVDPTKKSRHLNPVFSHLKQDTPHS